MRTQVLGTVSKGLLLELIGRGALERVGEVTQRLGHGAIEHHVGIGYVGLRAHGTELELVSGEGEGAGAVAVRVVLLKVGEHHSAQVDDAGGGVDRRLAVHDQLDCLGELVAQED